MRECVRELTSVSKEDVLAEIVGLKNETGNLPTKSRGKKGVLGC